MPSNRHLRWSEIREFGGLWTGPSALMPPNAASTMSGCHPQPGGGLRAFLKPKTMMASGDLVTLQCVPIGLGIVSKAVINAGDNTDPTFMLVTVDPTNFTSWRLWRYESNEATPAWFASTGPGTTFNDIDSNANARTAPPPGQPWFARMLISGISTTFLGLSIRESPASGSGLHTVNPLDGVTSQHATAFRDAFGCNTLVEHQARLVGGDYTGVVRFSAPGTQDFAGAGSGTIAVNPQGFWLPGSTEAAEGAGVAWLASVSPGDLVVATRDGRIYNIQGDLGDPSVREIARTGLSIPYQQPASGPHGVYFMLPNVGVVSLSLDGNIQPLSEGLDPSIWGLNTYPQNSMGQLVLAGRYLFAPNNHNLSPHNNGPLVFDTATGAWFTATNPGTAALTTPRFMQADNNPSDGRVWVVNQRSFTASTQVVMAGYPTGAVTPAERNEHYIWQSAPLREPTGRQAHLREINISFVNHNSLGSLQVYTNYGGSTNVEPATSGHQVYRVLFDKRDTPPNGEPIKITVESRSNATGVEAPTIESINIGWKPGHLR